MRSRCPQLKTGGLRGQLLGRTNSYGPAAEAVCVSTHLGHITTEAQPGPAKQEEQP